MFAHDRPRSDRMWPRWLDGIVLLASGLKWMLTFRVSQPLSVRLPCDGWGNKERGLCVHHDESLCSRLAF